MFAPLSIQRLNMSQEESSSPAAVLERSLRTGMTRRDLLRRAAQLSTIGAVAATGIFAKTETASAGAAWYGATKDIWYEQGHQGDWRYAHHYVDFYPRACANGTWRVQGPQNPGFWGAPPRCSNTIRAYYRWPGSLQSPWPASAWKLYIA